MAQAALTSPIWLKAWGEVAEQCPRAWVGLFGEQAEVVGAGGGPLEGRPGLVRAPREGLDLGEPEGAQQETALA